MGRQTPTDPKADCSEIVRGISIGFQNSLRALFHEPVSLELASVSQHVGRNVVKLLLFHTEADVLRCSPSLCLYFPALFSL